MAACNYYSQPYSQPQNTPFDAEFDNVNLGLDFTNFFAETDPMTMGTLDPSLLNSEAYPSIDGTTFNTGPTSGYTSGYATPAQFPQTPQLYSSPQTPIPRSQAQTPFQLPHSIPPGAFSADLAPLPFRPSSAPNLGDQNLYQYPAPSSGFHEQVSPWAYAAPPVPMNLANMAPTYQQTSFSYPGSPTQPIDPTYSTYGQIGPMKMPRQTREYYPVSQSNMDDSFDSDESMPPPPRKSSRKRAAVTKQYANKRTKKSQSQHPILNDFDDADFATLTPETANIAVKSRIRRSKNPGRPITVTQTDDVIKRNLARRERYRNSLPPAKRAQYDRNCAIAKGLMEDPDE